MESVSAGSPNIEEAIAFAIRIHSGGLREGGSPLPYISHPFEVLHNLRYVGKVTDKDMWCAAILHDTIESGGTALSEIEYQFGVRVAFLVGELTRREPDSTEISELTKREIWRRRAQMLIDETSNMSPDAQQIKLADRLANLCDAFRLKKGAKLERYLWQTNEILKVVPREVNLELWDAVAQLAKS